MKFIDYPIDEGDKHSIWLNQIVQAMQASYPGTGDNPGEDFDKKLSN